MHALTSRLRTIDTHRLYLLLIACGVLLAIQVNHIQHGWINGDSVLYMEAAKLFAKGEWTQGFSLYSWPLYSLLIAGAHQLFGFDFHLSAQLLDIIFFGITVASFFRIILLAGGGRRVLLTGALILFSSGYIAGDILPMLLRDQGFWAFFLTSLVFLIRFIDTRSFKHALLWQVTAVLAMLFRVEAISYLVLLPFVIFYQQSGFTSSRIKLFLKLYSLTVPAACLLFLLLLLNQGSAAYMGRLHEIFTSNFFDQLTSNFVARSHVMGSEVLGEFLNGFATASLLLTLIYIVIVKVLSTPGWLVSLLAASEISSRGESMKAEVTRVLFATMGITLLNLFLIICKVFVLSGRYVIPIALIIMLFAAFSLARGLHYLDSRDRKDRYKRWAIVLVLLIMTLGLIKNILPKRHGFNFEQDAVAWVKLHNPDHAPVYYDSARLRYYADAPYIGREESLYWAHLKSMARNQELGSYRFLLVSIKQGDTEKETVLKNELPQFHEVQRFWETRHKKSVVILSNEDTTGLKGQ